MGTIRGWTTGDPSSIAIWEHLPSGQRCHLVLEDAEGHLLLPSAWSAVEEVLPSESEHTLAHMIVQAEEGEVEVECAGHGDVGACRILQVHGTNLRAHWDVTDIADGWQMAQDASTIALAPPLAQLPADIPRFLDVQRDQARQAVPQAAGILSAPVEAMEAVIAANTIVWPDSNDLVTISRFDTAQQGEVRLRNWETFLTALATAYIDPRLAVESARTALRLLHTNGMLRAEVSPDGRSTELSHPPVAAYCIWKIYQLTGDRQLLAEAYPLLLHWHNWWRNFRDGNQDGFFEWASMDETGMPGHPLYTGVGIDERTHVMMLDDVALSSLWSLDAFALMRMALVRSDLDQATHLEREWRDMANHLNLRLWEEGEGLYRSRRWDLHPVQGQSVTTFLPFIARIPSREHIRRLLVEHFSLEFATPHLLPTVGMQDHAFHEQLPWRGRVSAILNFLVAEGMRHHGLDAWAEAIALSGLELLTASWLQDRQAFSSYNALTGKGADLPHDPLAPTAALLGALGIGMLIDVEPWDGVRLGNLTEREMAITGFRLHGNSYDVASGGHGLSASRNGQPWLETDRPVILRNIFQTDREISLQASLLDGGTFTLTVHGYPPQQEITVKVNGNLGTMTTDAAGTFNITVQVPPPAMTFEPPAL